MNHLKGYSQFLIRESYKDNPSINWYLIQTAKDLALDYLDDGYELKYTVCYYQGQTKDLKETIFKRSGKRTHTGKGLFGRKIRENHDVLYGVYSHDEDLIQWQNDFFAEDEILRSSNLSYYFRLIKPNKIPRTEPEISRKYNVAITETEQLVSTLKEIFPKERKIKDLFSEIKMNI
jgi:hypothetical protein